MKRDTYRTVYAVVSDDYVDVEAKTVATATLKRCRSKLDLPLVEIQWFVSAQFAAEHAIPALDRLDGMVGATYLAKPIPGASLYERRKKHVQANTIYINAQQSVSTLRAAIEHEATRIYARNKKEI